MNTIGILLLLICISIISSFISSGFFINKYISDEAENLRNRGKCNDIDDNGDYMYTQGELLGKYDDRLCILNPLLVSDPTFRESVLSSYSPQKMITAIRNIVSGNWTYPSTKLIGQDPILANMIINPWYSADDALNDIQTVRYSKGLNYYIINDTIYNNFDDSGLNLSSYIDNKETYYYLFIDNNVIIELPIQLYIYNLDKDQQKDIKVKVDGIIKTLNVEPIKINTLEELNTLLSDKFYKFRDTTQKDVTCLGLNPDGQKNADPYCKFFSGTTGKLGSIANIGSIVTTLKRVVVVPIQNELLVSEYIQYVEDKVNKNIKITLLEFFMLLAMKSHRDNITYDFVLDKTLN